MVHEETPTVPLAGSPANAGVILPAKSKRIERNIDDNVLLIFMLFFKINNKYN
jgi:hypothetical protein